MKSSSVVIFRAYTVEKVFCHTVKSLYNAMFWVHRNGTSYIKMEHPIYVNPVIKEQFYKRMKKVNKQCLLDTPRTVRVSQKTWHVIVQTRRP